ELQEFAREAAANDPKTLKKQIADLQAQLKKATVAAKVTPEIKVQKVDLSKAKVELANVSACLVGLRNSVQRAQAALDSFTKAYNEADARLKHAEAALVRAENTSTLIPVVDQQRVSTRNDESTSVVIRSSESSEQVKLKAGARRMLAALTASKTGTMTRGQMGTLGGMSIKSGTF